MQPSAPGPGGFAGQPPFGQFPGAPRPIGGMPGGPPGAPGVPPGPGGVRPPVAQFQNMGISNNQQGAPPPMPGQMPGFQQRPPFPGGFPGAGPVQPPPAGGAPPPYGAAPVTSPTGGAPQPYGAAPITSPTGGAPQYGGGFPPPGPRGPMPPAGNPMGQPPPFGAPPLAGGMPGVRPPVPGFLPAGAPGANVPPGPPSNQKWTPPGAAGGMPGAMPGGIFPPSGPPMQGGPPAGPPGQKQQMPPPPPVGVPPGAPGPGGFTSPTSQQQQPGRPAASNRIDPTQIPRPVAQGPETTVFETRTGGAHNVPPPASARYIVKDRGSCSPRYMRVSLNNVPATNDLLNSSAMPFAVNLSPLALPDPADDPVQVVDLGELGPVRCGRCKAYMNAFVKFMSSGRNFICNFCGHNNTCPDAYFCHLGPDGRRRDADERPELCRGTVEFVAPPDYMVRPPMPPVHFFLIEVTQNAIATGATAACCSSVKAVLDSLQGGDRTLVGLATFDNTIQFYSFRATSSQPQMLVVSDILDVYAPGSAPLLSSLAQTKEQLSGLLDTIPSMFANNRVTDSCGLAAVEAAVEVLKPTGGKIHAFLSLLPSVGCHALKPREFPFTGERAEKEKLTVLNSQDGSIKNLAVTAAEYQICVDLSLLGQQYMDIASLVDLPLTTCGSIYNYTPFNPMLDYDQLVNDLRWNVSRPQGLEAVMRVRCSQGLDLEGYYGSFYKRPNIVTDIDLAAIDCDKSITARLVLTERLQNNSECYLQNALLYTTPTGQRRIRVTTIALPVVDNMSAIFKAADLDCQIHLLARKLAISLPGGTLGSIRELATTTTVSTLHAYRKYCATSSSAVQLILPEALKLLPLYTLALLKSNGLKNDVKPDDRALWVFNITSSSCGRVAAALYPRLVSVHKLLEPGRTTVDVVPEGLMLSSEYMDAGGVYLLENGFDAYIYIDNKVNPELLNDLLGVPTMEDLNKITQPLVLPVRDNPANRLLQDLLVKVRLQRCAYLKLRIVRKSDPSEVTFFNHLVEDRATAGQSYVEYLCHVHRLIQNKMA